MDELEISGQRYISTRRAAKDHKYSSDYIGQLIRGKKVVGQKVGRSWYVSEVSLTEYLDKEKMTTFKEPVRQVVQPVARPVVQAPIVEQARAPKIIAENIQIVEEPIKIIEPKKVAPAQPQVAHVRLGSTVRNETVEERGYRIPISVKEKKGLVYLADTQPMLPPTSTRRARPARRVQADEYVQPVEYVEEQQQAVQPEYIAEKKSGSALAKSFVMFAVGIFVCVVILGISISINSRMVFEEGKSLNTEFSL